MKSPLSILPSFAVAVFMMPLGASAVTYSSSVVWTGSSSAVISSTSNWSTGVKPNLNTLVVFDGSFVNAPQIDSATNTWGGIYVTTGTAKKDVTIGSNNSTTRVLDLNGGYSISSISANAALLLDDANNSNLTVDTKVTLEIMNDTSFIVNNGATLTINGTLRSWTNKTSASTRTITLSGGNAGTMTFNGPITDGTSSVGVYTSLNINTAGTVNLNGNNTYTGTTTIASGNINIGTSSAFGSGTVTLNSGSSAVIAASTDLSGANKLTNAFVVGGQSFGGNHTLELGGSTMIASAGTLTNNISGGGVLIVSGAVACGTSTTPANVYIAGSGTTEITGILGLSNGGANATLNYIGTGVLALYSANAYGGNSYIGSANAATQGAVKLYHDNGLIAGGVLTIYSGTFDLNGYGQQLNGLQLGFQNSSTGGAGATANVAIGSGTLILNGALQYNAGSISNSIGAATISGNGGGKLDLAVAGSGSITRAINVGHSSANGGAADLTISAIIEDGNSNVASLIKYGNGNLVLSGSNTYSGGTFIGSGSNDGGLLSISSDSNLGAAGKGVTFQGSTSGTLQTTASFSSNRAFVFNNTAGTEAIETAIDTTLTLTGTLSGAGAFTKIGAGTLVLTGSNSYSGGTVIGSDSEAGGTLSVSSDSNLGAAGVGIVFSGTAGGELQATASFSSDRAIAINAGNTATIETVGTDTNLTLTNISDIHGDGSLIKTGAGTLTLDADGSYTGTTTISAGEFAVNGSLDSSPVNVETGARLSGAGTVSSSVSVTNGSINGNGLSFGAATFSGTSTISGTNTATNGIAITGGTTSLTGHTTVTGTVSVDLGATFVNHGTVSGYTEVKGLLNGAGTIDGTLYLHGGTLSAGSTCGITTVTGDYTMDSSATLMAAVTGTASGAFDQVKVSGNVTLAGTLDLTMLNGLTLGDKVVLIDNIGTGTTNGWFETIIANGLTFSDITQNTTYDFSVNSLTYEISYGVGSDANDVTLTVVPEPSTWAIFMVGIGSLIGCQRIRNRHRDVA